MTDQEIWGEAVKWVSEITGLTVIKSRQSGARPSQPYMMVDLVGVEDIRQFPANVSFEETDTLNSEGEKEVLARPLVESEWTFLLFSYGDEPMAPLGRLKRAMHIREAVQSLHGQGVVIHDTGRINSIPEEIGGRWEPRAQMNLFLRRVEPGDGFIIETVDQLQPFDIQRT